MKLLLTSGGVTNPSIEAALVRLLGRPVAESHALVVPTAQWGHPMCGPASVRGLVSAEPAWHHLSGMGWASLGVLELTALPTVGRERWVPWVDAADVLLVDGGDATYLCHWMRESGLVDLLPSLPDTVCVGVSAGGPKASACRPGPSTTRPPSRSSTARSRWSRKGGGSGSAARTPVQRARVPRTTLSPECSGRSSKPSRETSTMT